MDQVSASLDEPNDGEEFNTPLSSTDSSVAGSGGADADELEDQEPLEEFPPDEEEAQDTTAHQHYEEGKDLQGIPWERLQVSRAEYRQQRVQRYHNYMNCIPEGDCPAVRAELIAGWPQPSVLADSQWPYAFVRNWRAVASSIVHFQLRNLLWAASAHDVAVVYDNRVQHWNSVTRSVRDVLDLRGWPKGPRLPGISRVQVSTMCVHEGLLAAGGFSGELVLASMQHTEQGPAWDEKPRPASSLGTATGQRGQSGGSCSVHADRQCGWQQQGQQWGSEQAALMVQQQVLTAANQLYPAAARAVDWAPDQQHCSSLAWPRLQQQHTQQQQLPAECGRPQQQKQQQDGLTQRQQARPPEGEPLMGAAGPATAQVLHCCRVTQSENGITNGIEIFNSCNYGHCVMTSNNDCCVRVFDVEGCRPRQRLPFDFAVNYATLRPAGAAPGGGAVAAVVGDDPGTWLVDLRCGVQMMQLGGHRDFSFAAAWDPAGHLLATGSQDSTTRAWDLRSPREPLAVLGGSMGAIRSLRFSPDGAYLAAAEPADFVHVYDVGSGFGRVQEIDLFGEVAGISFSPDSQAFFVAISDTLYNSLVQYQRCVV